MRTQKEQWLLEQFKLKRQAREQEAKYAAIGRMWIEESHELAEVRYALKTLQVTCGILFALLVLSVSAA